MTSLHINALRGRPMITISDEARKQAVASIRQYFQIELGREVGDLKVRSFDARVVVAVRRWRDGRIVRERFYHK